MDTGALISIIVLLLFFGGIFITAISYEVWKVQKKNSSNKTKTLNKSKQQLNTDSIKTISKKEKAEKK